MKVRGFCQWLVFTCAFATTFGIPLIAFAATAEELRAQINTYNQQITALEAEIAQYQKQLNSVNTQKQTLQSTLTSLDLSRKKINANISVAQNQISATQLEIQELGGSIQDTETSIERGTEGLAESLRTLQQVDSVSLAMLVLSAESISDFWNTTDTLAQFQDGLQEQINSLETAKDQLETAKIASEEKQATLIAHRNELAAQQRALDVNRKQQAELLAQTKRQESTYQKIIADKQAARASFAKALSNYESQLKFTLDPSTIPVSGKGVLRWPLAAVRITQYFGNTAFAQSGAYNGKGHNGMDLAASIGTPIYAALGGTVEGTGNTDIYPGCYSYGKWILIRHPNGISTIYAHLSQIDVAVGDQISTGEVIGYTGFTGYATGPHLHFSTYVSEAVRLVKLGSVKSQTNCANATIPVAPLNAYLNPIDYLPPR